MVAVALPLSLLIQPPSLPAQSFPLVIRSLTHCPACPLTLLLPPACLPPPWPLRPVLLRMLGLMPSCMKQLLLKSVRLLPQMMMKMALTSPVALMRRMTPMP